MARKVYVPIKRITAALAEAAVRLCPDDCPPDLERALVAFSAAARRGPGAVGGAWYCDRERFEPALRLVLSQLPAVQAWNGGPVKPSPQIPLPLGGQQRSLIPLRELALTVAEVITAAGYFRPARGIVSASAIAADIRAIARHIGGPDAAEARRVLAQLDALLTRDDTEVARGA